MAGNRYLWSGVSLGAACLVASVVFFSNLAREPAYLFAVLGVGFIVMGFHYSRKAMEASEGAP